MSNLKPEKDDERRNCWIMLDEVFQILRSPNESKERKAYVARNLTNKIKIYLNDLAVHDNNTLILIRSFLMWLAQNAIELLAKKELISLTHQIVSCVTLLFNHILSLATIDLREVFECFGSIIRAHMSTITYVHRGKVLGLLVKSDQYVPSYIIQREICVSVNPNIDMSGVYCCFYMILKFSPPQLTYSHSYAVYLLQLSSDMIQFCNLHVRELGIEIVCKLFIMLRNPLVFDTWHMFNHCLKQFYKFFINRDHVKLPTIDFMADALKHAVLLGGSGVSSINYEMFMIGLDILSCLVENPRITDSVKKAWVDIVLGLLKLTSVDFSEKSEIETLVYLIHNHEVLYPVYEECLVQSLETYILKHSIGSNKVSAQIIEPKSENLRRNIVVYDKVRLWTGATAKLIEIIDANDGKNEAKFKSDMTLVLNIMRSGCKLKRLLENKYEDLELEFFGPKLMQIIGQFPQEIKLTLKDNYEIYGLFVQLVSMSIKIVGENMTDLRDASILFFMPWQEPNASPFDLEAKRASIESLCYLTIKWQIPIPPYTKALVELLYRIIIDGDDPELMDLSLTSLIYIFLHLEENYIKDRIINILEYIITSQLDLIFRNKLVGRYILCILQNRCVINSKDSFVSLTCLDCDLGSQNLTPPPPVQLSKYVQYVSFEYCNIVLGYKEGYKDIMCAYICQYWKHNSLFASPTMVSKMMTILSEPSMTDRIEFTQHLWTLASKPDGTIDMDVVKTMYSHIKDKLLNLQSFSSNERQLTLKFIIKFLLKLTSLPEAKELVIPSVKILLAYCIGLEMDEGTVKKFMNPILTQHYLNLEKILISKEEHLSEFLAELIVYNLHRDKYQVWKTVLQFSLIFGLKPDKALTSYSTRHILSHIMTSCEPKQVEFLYQEIAEFLGLTMQQLVTNYFEDIFCHCYFLDDESMERKNNMVNLLLKLAENDIKTLIYFRYTKFFFQTVLNSQKAISIIRFLFKITENDSDIESQESFLKQNIVGLLTTIDAKLTFGKSSDLFVSKCLRTIVAFIKILGPEAVTSIRIKLLNTLRTGVQRYINKFPKQCLKIWLYFCYSVDLHKMAPYLSTIVLQLLPLYSYFPEDVANLLYYLVVENGQACAEYIPDLYFVPDEPENQIMHTVWKTIKSVFSNEEDYRHHIRRTIEHMNYDSMDARASAMKQLYQLLKDYAHKLHDTALKCDTLDPLFEEIVSCIMSNVDYDNTEVKIACAMCLGELGALDPARFPFKAEKVKEKNDIYDIKSKNFASLCIGVMVRELNKLDKIDDVNVIVSSIQELLKMYFQKREKGIFANFTVNEIDVLEPLLQTRYIFKPPTLKLRPFYEIVFGSHVGSAPTKWAFNWCSELLTFVPNSFAKDVFLKCLPCFCVNLQIVETILPYIVMYVLLNCSMTDVCLIEKEMKCILHWDIDRERTHLPIKLSLLRDKKSDDVSAMYSEEKHTKYLSIILDLIDFLYKAYVDIEVHDAKLGFDKKSLRVSNLKYLLEQFSAPGLSLKSYVQKDFCRSLYHVERSLSDSDYHDINMFPLRNTYAKLNDLDGLLGVMRCSKKIPTIEERMLKHVVSGNVQDAVGGYEHLGKKYNSTNSYRVLIQCYLSINQPFIALRLSKTLINESFYMEPSLFNDHVEVLWSTSSYLELNKVLDQLGPGISNNWCWGIDLIGAFQHIRQLSIENMNSKISSMQCHIIDCLAEINSKSIFKYRHGYWYIVKLHILNELVSFAHLLYSSCSSNTFDAPSYERYFNQLNSRFNLLPSHGHFIQDVLKVRQQCMMVAINLNNQINFSMSGVFLKELGKTWIQSVKMERKNGSLSNAYSNIGIAEMYSPPDLFIQKAKYYRANNETDSAVFVLKQGIRQLTDSKHHEENLMLNARAKMLIAKYDVENMNVDFNKGYECIYEAVSLYNLEQSFVYLAQYLYKQHLLEQCPDKRLETREIQYKAALNFGKSLLFGCKFIYQSMPCLLTLWLDFAARAAKDLPLLKEEHKARITSITDLLNQFNSLMENTVVCLPTYMFMTAFSQILSRINHPSPHCFSILKLIILNIIQEYPQQAMWSIVSTFKTGHEHQKKRVSEILAKLKKNREMARFVHGFIEFVNYLIDLSNRKTSSYTSKMKLDTLSPELRKSLKSRNVNIMVPSQHLRNVDVPNYKYCKSVMARMQHNPFPHAMVYFKDVQEIVDVLFSVQKPKKLTFIGSDGKLYPILCKHMDDLRLDSRIMEFNSIINLYLRRDSAAHDRGLLIRTYSVVPLNHECGLIEWLPNVTPFKHIITQMYKQFDIQPMKLVEIKNLMTPPADPIQKKLEVFEKILLPRHPPILHKWFFQAFPRPDAWYLARQSYVRTLAVMSIVGYIVGLGDRHGENILVDTTTGEIVHVDFNCLFNKGDHFPYPETVPFRLTQNMVKAMGPTGMEGVFFKSCEITNRVLRSNADQLISVIKPFLYDIDRAPKSAMSNRSGDIINQEAKQNLINVHRRLNGIVRTKTGVNVPVKQSNPLSVEGQIRCLVEEAMSHTNLCQLYCGWAPFL